MSSRPTLHNTMRVYHRYLGFFLAGIMAVYAFSGMLMIFRTTDFLKQTKELSQQLAPGLTAKEVGEAIRMRDLKFESSNGPVQNFKQGSYNSSTGMVNYSIKTLPTALDKLTKLHKASTKDPLFYLNIFFGLSLLFFVVSSFWMFLPQTSVFKKGMYFTMAGVVLVLIMLFI